MPLLDGNPADTAIGARKTPATGSLPDAGSEQPFTTSVYYRNCSAARAVGVTPLRAGSPGYSAHLDRDGDGVACEQH